MIVDEISKQLPKVQIKYVKKDEDPRDYRVSFEKIKRIHGVTESEVIKIMRTNLKPRSFKLWRTRVTGRTRKHEKKSCDLTYSFLKQFVESWSNPSLPQLLFTMSTNEVKKTEEEKEQKQIKKSV